jgi:hypothetical protein
MNGGMAQRGKTMSDEQVVIDRERALAKYYYEVYPAEGIYYRC